MLGLKKCFFEKAVDICCKVLPDSEKLRTGSSSYNYVTKAPNTFVGEISF